MKKRIILVIVVFIFLLIMIGITLYFTTDILKSDSQLFYKYIAQNEKLLKIMDCESLIKSKEMKKQNPYISKAEATIEIIDDSKNINEKIEVKANGKNDEEKQISNFDIKLQYNNKEFWETSYIRNQAKYALRLGEVTNSYIGIQNKDLKRLAEKMGIDDTSTIPNQISFDKINEIFNLKEDEKQYIIKEYLAIMIKIIPKERYTSTMQENMKGYTLTLTEQDIVEIKKALLEKLKEDDKTLNIIINRTEKLKDNNSNIDINKLKKKINDAITDLKNKQYSNDEQIKITAYVKKDETVQTTIEITNEKEFEISHNKKNIGLLYKDLKDEKNSFMIFIDKKEELDSTKVIVLIMANNFGPVKIEWQSDVKNEITNNINIIIQKGETTLIECTYKSKINFTNEISEYNYLNSNNSIILNECTKEQLQQLVPEIIEKTRDVFNQKFSLISHEK